MVLVGGRTNTLLEFDQLARSAGLEVSAVESQRGGGLIVECRPS